MEKNEKVESEVSWDDLGGNYLKFSDGEKAIVYLKDWKLSRVVNPFKKKDTDPLVVIQLEADVTEKNGVIITEPKLVLKTTSLNLINAFKPVLKLLDPVVGVKLRIKRIGDKEKTTYDIEVVE